jgi:DNA-directed RNA polymerase subunit RPC12/RpoP
VEKRSDNWKIEHACPQCSAPVLLEDTDRLLVCPFCRVKLFISTDSHFRYFIPPRMESSDELIMIPYWRFRGMHFAVRLPKTDSRVVDATIQGYVSSSLPLSLGVRPQAVKLRFLLPEMKRHFYLPELSFREVMPVIEKRLLQIETITFNRRMKAAQMMPDLVFHRTFIGETSSLIYLPARMDGNAMIDQVSGSPLSGTGLSEQLSFTKYRDWRLDFIPLLCPECGWDLDGERQSLALACPNCSTLWMGSGGNLKKVPYAIIEKRTDAIYLPFWRVRAEMEGARLDTFADLVRFSNLPRVVQPEWEERRLYIWIPAFKLQPRAFLAAIRKATVTQLSAGPEGSLSKKRILPLTLPEGDLKDCIMLFMTEVAIPKKRFLPTVSDIKIDIAEKEIVLVPFSEERQEFIQEDMHLTIGKNLFRFGRNI